MPLIWSGSYENDQLVRNTPKIWINFMKFIYSLWNVDVCSESGQKRAMSAKISRTHVKCELVNGSNGRIKFETRLNNCPAIYLFA